MPKTLTLRVDDETYDAFVKRAKAENRSVANFIENAVKIHIQEHDFVDDEEMTEILANERLVARLKLGSQQARRRSWPSPSCAGHCFPMAERRRPCVERPDNPRQRALIYAVSGRALLERLRSSRWAWLGSSAQA